MRFTSPDELFENISKSSFRSRFKLTDKELSYIQKNGITKIREHAKEFVRSRLADAFPTGDGHQTPMKNHPVFIAQHATATCCRGCLEEWHYIRIGRALEPAQIDYVVNVIMWWLEAKFSAAEN